MQGTVYVIHTGMCKKLEMELKTGNDHQNMEMVIRQST